jgi:phage baseplate assembly protein W
MNPIGIIFPLTKGNAGFFNQSYDTTTQIKSNIINLLRTNSGERRMQPLFSSGLMGIVFDMKDDTTTQIIKKTIEDKIKMWIPAVSIKNIDLNITNGTKTDSYRVYIKIDFIINNQLDTVVLDFISN